LHASVFDRFNTCVRIFYTQAIRGGYVNQTSGKYEDIGCWLAINDTVAVGDAIKEIDNLQALLYHTTVFAG
jgi:hypothetical protein